MDKETTPRVAATPVASPAPKPVDTYSYKGWMNSDMFWKRALGVYGYYIVGALMIVIPLLVVMLGGTILFGALFFGAPMHGQQNDFPMGQKGYEQTAPNAKINIDMVCNDALEYMDSIKDATSAAKYVQDCKDGKHPEAVERYIKSINLPDDAAI